MQDSIWFRTLKPEEAAALAAADPFPSRAEVVIVGAGMIGLAAAYYLSGKGVREICVLDRGPALGEASGANAGGLWFAQQSLELGPLGQLADHSRQLYKELAGRFEFDFVSSGVLELIEEERQLDQAEHRAEQVRQNGFRAELLAPAQVRQAEPALAHLDAAALLYPDDAHLHPARLAAAWVRLLRERGVRFCTNVEVERAGFPVGTNRGAIQTDALVIAAGAWTPLVTDVLGWRPPIRPIRGALLALPAQPPGTLRHVVLTPRYYYWQLAGGPIAGGGSIEDVGFEPGLNQAVVRDIRSELNRYLPALAETPIECVWSGFRPFCEDSLPIIGQIPECGRTFVAAGHFRKGVMMAPITGRIIADLVVDGGSPVDLELFSPTRFASQSVARS